MKKLRKFETEDLYISSFKHFPSVYYTENNGLVWLKEEPCCLNLKYTLNEDSSNRIISNDNSDFYGISINGSDFFPEKFEEKSVYITKDYFSYDEENGLIPNSDINIIANAIELDEPLGDGDAIFAMLGFDGQYLEDNITSSLISESETRYILPQDMYDEVKSFCSNFIMFVANEKIESNNPLDTIIPSTNYCSLSNFMLPEEMGEYNVKIELNEGVNELGKDPGYMSIRVNNLIVPLFGNTSISEIVIPNCINKIHPEVFKDCVNLSSVTIPNSVTSINRYAFYTCLIQKDNFINNSSLDAEANNYWGATIYDTLTEDGLYIKDTTIVKAKKGITDIIIPNYITKIDDHSFDSKYNLSSVTFEENSQLTSIGSYVFQYCRNLTSVTIPNSVKSIGKYAFSYCHSLTSITIPSSVTSISDNAFSNCNNLTSVTFEEGSQLTTLYNSFNNNENLKTIELEKCTKLTSIKQFAFSKCTSLTSITIPSSVTSIASDAFTQCIMHKDNFINKSTLNAEENNYWSCGVYDTITESGLYTRNNSVLITCGSEVTDIIVPNTITKINCYAFMQNQNITSVTFEEGSQLTSIETYAFYDNDGLTSINIPNGVTKITSYNFCSCNLNEVIIPASVTNLEYATFQSNNYLNSITCYATTAPTLGSYALKYLSSNGKLRVPQGSDYSTWLSVLGSGWTIEYITE